MALTFIDSHCHLQSLPESMMAYARHWVNQTQKEAIERVLSVCLTLDDLPRLASLARIFPGFIDISAGIHPCDVANMVQRDIDVLRLWSSHEHVVAIGEIGLDYYHTTEHIKQQRWAFEAQMHVAEQQQLPVIIHTRQAVEDTLSVLRQFPKVKGVLHCFTEDIGMAEQAMALGYYISFSGIITFKKSNELRTVVRSVPLSHMLIETDAPYLAPHPNRGKTNESKWVRWVAEKVAEIHHVSLEEVSKVTTQNYYDLFAPSVSHETNLNESSA